MSNLFNCFDNIFFDDFDSFNKALEKAESEHLSPDRTLIAETGNKINLEDMESVDEGCFTVVSNNVEFDCFLSPRKGEKLYVILNGGRPYPGCKLPAFGRWSWYNYFNGTMLNIADPMLKLDDKLVVGWYYGTKDEFYLDYVIPIIKRISEILSISVENIIFYGSSGGGYAGIYCGIKLEGSTVIAINPQLKLSCFLYMAGYLKDLISESDSSDKFGRNDLIPLIKSNTRSRIFLLENAKSRGDMEQAEILCNEIGIKFKYGFNTLKDKLFLWVYSANAYDPHVAYEWNSLSYLIQEIALNEKFDADLTNDILIINKIWSDYSKENHNYETYKRKKNREVSGIFFGSETSKNGDVVYTADNLSINDSDNIYNHIAIYSKFKTNKLYKLYIGSSELICGESCNYTIIVKDIMTGGIPLLKAVKIEEETILYFKTSSESNGLELRIYPGEIGKSSGIGMKFYGVKLFEFNNAMDDIQKVKNYSVERISVYDEDLIQKSTRAMKKRFVDYDSRLIKKPVVELQNSADLARAENGIYKINFENVDLEFLYAIPEKNAKKLYCFLNGALTPQDSLPLFKRWSYYSMLDGYYLNVSDPMLRRYSKLKLGWYYGDDDICYMDIIVRFICEVKTVLNLDDVIFVGSSGGGYAALYCSCQIDSMCISINPQILLKMHGNKKWFEEVSRCSLEIEDKFGRNDLPRLLHERRKKGKILLCENVQSDEDMLQLRNLGNEFGKDVYFGISSLSSDFYVWTYNASKSKVVGHNVQEYRTIFSFMDYIVCNNSITVDEVIPYINQVWREHFEIMDHYNEICAFSFFESNFLAGYISDTDQITVQSTDNIWNNVIVPNTMENYSAYGLYIKSSSVISGEFSEFTLIIKNDVSERIIYRKELPVGKPFELLLFTSDESENCRIKFYSGIAGVADKKELMIDYKIIKL